MRIVVFFLLVFIVTSCSYFSPEPVSVENSFLKVSVDTANDNFTVRSEKIDEIIVRNAEFFRKIESAETKPVEESFRGEGDEILVSLEDGSKISLRLFNGSPFVRLHAKVHNPGSNPIDMKSLELLDMDIALDGEKIMSYGTGGLRGPSGKNGSYEYVGANRLDYFYRRPVWRFPPDSIENEEEFYKDKEGEYRKWEWEKDHPKYVKPSHRNGSYTFHAFADQDTRNGIVTAGLTHERSIGAFFPRARKNSNNPSLKVQLDFGHYEVNPGETRPTDIVILGYFDDARIGLEKYASAVSSYYDIKLKPKPGVYCTWYHARASDEEAVERNTEFAANHLKPFGLNVIQIDDRWQSVLPEGFEHEGEIKTTGPVKVFVDSKSNYPSGMEHMAEVISSHGMTPGIWFTPFAGNFRNPYFDDEIFAQNPDGTPFHVSSWSGTCIDMTDPKAQDFVYERTKRLYDRGYNYLKMDGLHTGMATNLNQRKSYHDVEFGKAKLDDSHKTHVQAYRKGLEVVRDAAPEAFLLGCNADQNTRILGPSFGLVDAMRIGPDNGRALNERWMYVLRGARHGTSLYFLNGRVWHNDPDPVYVSKSLPIKWARWMCSWMAVSGTMPSSSAQYDQLSPDRLDILKRTLPTHNLPARPVDLFESGNPRIWLVSNDRLNIIGLFNWRETKPETITYDMDKLGLEKNKTYVAFDYWADRFVEPFRNELNRELSPASCQVLAVRPQREHPQLLSTSRHITQGLMDVIDEKWEADSKTLSGTSKLVGGDPCELRIALPPESSLKPERASAKGADIKISKVDERGIRVTITSEKSQKVAWQVSFE